MGWPQAPDYVEVVQHLTVSVSDPELREGVLVNNAVGLPITRSGSFATVFQVHRPDGSGDWALKCFTKRVANLQERYRAVEAHLQQHARLPFMVPFRYLPEGILVDGQWYPLLTMDWAEGLRLDEFLDDCLKRANYQAKLHALCRMWLRLAHMLREARVGHGDLQHGNVILVPVPERKAFQLKLIDYDGMYVPELAEQVPAEIGHPAFQHPQRSMNNGYGAEVDRFSHLLIYWTLRCLIVGGRELWDRYYNGDRLLVDRHDLWEPERSSVFRETWGSPDQAVQSLTGHLMLAAKSPLDHVPLLEQVVTDSDVVALSGEQQEQIARWMNGRAWHSSGRSQPSTTDRAGQPQAPRAAQQSRKRRSATAATGPARTVDQRLLECIKTGAVPRDYYELLGQDRCHPHREDLFAAVRECNRVLHEFQNHQDAMLADRAIQLQMEVAEALETFSDDGRWQEYDARLIGQWRGQYAVKNGQDASRWRPEGLRRWLATRRVHPARLDEIAALMMRVEQGIREEPGAEPGRPRSFRSTAFPRAAESGRAASSSRRRRPRPESEVTPTPGSLEWSSAGAPSRPAGTAEEPPVRAGEVIRGAGGPPPLPSTPFATLVEKPAGARTAWVWWLVGSAAACVLLCVAMAMILLIRVLW